MPWRVVNQTAVATGTRERVATAPALDAPNINFASTPTDLPLDACMTRARASLERAGLTGQDTGRYFAWGYQRQNTGLVWCHTDSKLVIFLAAGKNGDDTSQLAEALRRTF